MEKKEGDQVRLETEGEFLNRMSGLIRIFCKLMVRRGPPFDIELKTAWRWMSDIMNLPPRQNITALLYRIFFDEIGENMFKEYSIQFVKITDAIGTQYFDKLRNRTTDDQMTRLQLSLDTLKNKMK